MDLTNTLALLSLLFATGFAVGSLIIKMQRNDEKHSNNYLSLLAIVTTNKEQNNKDITDIEKKTDSVTSDFRNFVNKHFETEASNNREIMQKLEQNNRDIMQKFEEVGKKFDDTNKEITQIKLDMMSMSIASNKRVIVHKTINDR